MDKGIFKCVSSGFMLISGVGLCVEPVGEIHDSVLWYFAQCLIYAGSAVGIDVLIDERIKRNRDS
jgi:hypothetical protein